MKRGLLLGKFMPLHKGHMELIEFASQRCDELTVLICATVDEPIAGSVRLEWLNNIYNADHKIKPRLLIYDEALLPNTSTSSESVSRLWAGYLKEKLFEIDIFFSSEPYGKYMGEFLGCEYVIYDAQRSITSISSTQIRNRPFAYWDFIPAEIKPYYVKKICIYGTESTGKTTLTKKLADFFNTTYVIEMAREILEKTLECEEHHLMEIATLHAKTINEQVKSANKLLFVDTDINITRSYSKFLFKKQMEVPEWIDEANNFDLYLYLDNDVPHVQDGTRLEKTDRDLLNDCHQRELTDRNIDYILLKGDWNDKFGKAITIINERYGFPVDEIVQASP
ncbi:MAG TPA: AAA family ATPase [Mucilaginibacter sp.]|nr:AAA family ATPase [Mucilaginibacter sp.]